MSPCLLAPGVSVWYTNQPDMFAQFRKKGFQIAAGVPFMIGEPAGNFTFRIGLFGRVSFRRHFTHPRQCGHSHVNPVSGVASHADLFEIEGLFTQGSRTSRTVGESSVGFSKWAIRIGRT